VKSEIRSTKSETNLPTFLVSYFGFRASNFLFAVPAARAHAALFASDLAAAGAAAASSHRHVSLLNAYPQGRAIIRRHINRDKGYADGAWTAA
jgi:hypothetical protein